MAEHRDPKRAAEQEEAWDLLPWYVTGRLDEEEARRVEAQLGQSEVLAEELAMQRRLAEAVAEQDPDDAIEARGWEQMQARILQPEQPAEPVIAPPEQRRKKLRWPKLSGLTDAISMPGFAAPAMLSLGVAIFAAGYFVSQPGETVFETMTSDGAPSSTVIRIQVAEGTSEQALRVLLVGQQLRIVDGPTETGVYTLAPAEDADLAALSASLSSAPEIAVVLVRTGR